MPPPTADDDGVRFPPPDEQLRVLRLGAVHLETEAELRAKLAEGRPLRIKCGFDPTTADLHLGHTIVMRKMAQFQSLGHQVDFVIGDHTALIGDPSGRDATRPVPSVEEVKRNAQTYQEQAFKVLDRGKTRIRYNSEWLGAMTFEDMIRLAGTYTVSRMLERNDFKQRHASGVPISIHELLYPLVQAYDSVELKTDVELGGDDQYFNLNVGRDVMRRYGLAAQCLLTTPLLEGLDGVKKMSKSIGNYVALDEPPFEMLSKMMSVSDELMWRYYELLSLESPEEIERRRAGHPRDVKMLLAQEIVERYHDQAAAEKAAARWRGQFSRRQVPEDLPTREIPAGLSIVEVMVEVDAASGKGDARRKIKQGGVRLNGERVEDPTRTLQAGEAILNVGKRFWIRLRVAAETG